MTPGPHGSPLERVEETDMELIDRWKAGDSRAATRLVGRHSQALARFAASAGERDGIEELVQDTFVRAFASLDSFRAESTLRTWLFTIERRLMLDRRRSERRSRETVPVEESDHVSEYGALDGLIAGESQEVARRAFSDAARGVHVEGAAGFVIQGDRRSTGKHRGCGTGPLPQR